MFRFILNTKVEILKENQGTSRYSNDVLVISELVTICHAIGVREKNDCKVAVREHHSILIFSINLSSRSTLT